jgi:hypothetical protein
MEFTTQEPVPPPYLTAAVVRSMKKEIEQKGLFFRLRLFSMQNPEPVFQITKFEEVPKDDDKDNNNIVKIEATTVVENPRHAEGIIIVFYLYRNEYTWTSPLLSEAQRLTITTEPSKRVKEGGSKKRTKKKKTKKRKSKRKNHK